MWTCPKCDRLFKSTNQWHVCGDTTIDDLFVDRSDHLVLAFDRILLAVMGWEPNSVGAAKRAVIFTNRKAWLILTPMTKELDLKFYLDRPLESERLKKVVPYGRKYVHHLRIRQEEEVDEEVLRLLREAFEFGLANA